jgi:hypothetical protein
MLVALAAGVLLALLLWSRARSRKDPGAPALDSTPALDAWVRESLELELAGTVLGIRGSTPEERRKLARTLAHEPDADVVARIEDHVRAVELEFVRYAHEADVETTIRVRYEDGKSGAASRRLALADVPETVRRDFEAKGTTRVFRTWSFPWQQVRMA